MIDAAGIPVIAGDMDAVAGHARALSTAGNGFAATGARVHTTWQGLAVVYRAPEAAELFAATGPIATVSASVGDDLESAGQALGRYADEVAAIQVELDSLRVQAGAFASAMAALTAAGEDWRANQLDVDRNSFLVDAVGTQIAAFTDAERRCANSLRALHGRPPLSVDDGDGQLDPTTEYGFTAAQLIAVGHDPGQVPWGHTEDRTPSWWEAVASFYGAYAMGWGDAGADLVLGLGALIGYGDGRWSTDNAVTAWTGLGTFAAAVAAYTGINSAGLLADRFAPTPGREHGELGATLVEAGKALIAYDQWDDDPARAGGHALGNIVAAVLGTKGAGTGLTAVGTAITAGRTTGLVAGVGKGISLTGRALYSIDELVVRHFSDHPVPRAPIAVGDDLARGNHYVDGTPGRSPDPHGNAGPTDPAGVDVQAAASAPPLDVRHAGARYLEEPESPAAARAYEEIRNSTDDTTRIAANTGYHREVLDIVKNHLFVQEHIMPIGPGQTRSAHFSPAAEIGDLWMKAANGALDVDEAQHFQRLVAHEFVESRLMKEGLPYRSSHPDAFDADGTPDPSARHHGAHDLAPLMDRTRGPFTHYRRIFGRQDLGVALHPDLSNLDEIVAAILRGPGQ